MERGKTVVVLSLPRSGSSLIAGMLQRLGVQMGDIKGLIRPSHVNKYGNYENQQFYKLNLNILYYAQSFSLSWADIPDDRKVRLAVKGYESELKSLIREWEQKSKLWGWKDPTISTTIPYFKHLLTNSYYIILKRDVESMVKSHLKAAKIISWYRTILYISRYFSLVRLVVLGWRIFKKFLSHGNVFYDEKRYETVIREGYRRIDDFVKNERHLYVYFDDLISDPQCVICKIINFLEISPSREQIQKARNFIDLREVHHQNHFPNRFSIPPMDMKAKELFVK
ncbi:MAG: sulfotransferase [Promethearchaeota archaeon]